jgi:hypothetical protein
MHDFLKISKTEGELRKLGLASGSSIIHYPERDFHSKHGTRRRKCRCCFRSWVGDWKWIHADGEMFSYYIELGDVGWLYSGQQKEWKENVFRTNNPRA